MRRIVSSFFVVAAATVLSASVATATPIECVHEKYPSGKEYVCPVSRSLFSQAEFTLHFPTSNNNTNVVACQEKEPSSSLSHVWSGTCMQQHNNDAGYANLVRLDALDHAAANWFGNVRFGEMDCLLRRQRGLERNSSQHYLECKPAVSPIFEEEEEELVLQDPAVAIVSNATFAMSHVNMTKTRKLRTHRRLYEDDGKHVDIMIVWTTNAECRNAGKADICAYNTETEEEMRGLIAQAVATTNTIFADSGMDMKLRLVHAYRNTEYNEVGRDSPLRDLWSKTGGYLDEVHDKRILYGADVVSVVVGRARACASYSNPTRAGGASLFTSNLFTCLRGTGFTHELGHVVSSNWQHVCAENRVLFLQCQITSTARCPPRPSRTQRLR